MLCRILPWFFGSLLGMAFFSLFTLTIIRLPSQQPDISFATTSPTDQSQIDQMVIASFHNPEVQNVLKLYMVDLMRTPEMRNAIVEMSRTPEMTAVLTDVLRTPEARTTMVNSLQTPEVRQYVYEMLPKLLSESFTTSDPVEPTPSYRHIK